MLVLQESFFSYTIRQDGFEDKMQKYGIE